MWGEGWRVEGGGRMGGMERVERVVEVRWGGVY